MDDPKTGTHIAGLTCELATRAAALNTPICPSRCGSWRGNACSTISASRSPGPATRWSRCCSTSWPKPAARAQASVIGHPTRLPALSAALVNGAAGHALDYDDVNLAMPGHPSVAILPGLLALAELRRSSGREVHHRLCRRLRDRLPDRHGAAARPLRSRLSRHRHGRQLRRGGGLRPAARPRCRGDRAGRSASPGPRRPGSNRNSARCASRSTPARRRRTGCWRRVSPRAAFRAGPISSNARRASPLTHGPDFSPEAALADRRSAASTSSPTSSNTTPPAT